MQHKLIGFLSLLLCSLLFAVPASAANLPQCAPGAFPGETSDFVLIADDNIFFEPQQANSGRIIQGNVLVTSLHPPGGTFNNTGSGFVKVGANTNIRGTVIADVIILPDGGAKIQACIANQILGSAVALSKGSCENLPTPTPTAPAAFNTYAAAHPACVDPPLGTLAAFSSLCGPTPVVAACANTAGPLTVANGDTLTLPPAPPPFGPATTCFGALVLGDGAVLNLGPGTWTFKSVQMKAGAKLLGPGGGATVNVNGKFATDPGVFITNIDLNIAQASSGEAATIQKNTTLTNVNINAPFGKCHIWTGTHFECSEACCKVLDVEPITAACVPTPGLFCVGATSITRDGNEIKLSGAGQNLNAVVKAFCSPDCTTTSPPAVEATFTFAAGELTITVPPGETCSDKLILAATIQGQDVQVCFDAP